MIIKTTIRSTASATRPPLLPSTGYGPGLWSGAGWPCRGHMSSATRKQNTAATRAMTWRAVDQKYGGDAGKDLAGCRPENSTAATRAKTWRAVDQKRLRRRRRAQRGRAANRDKDYGGDDALSVDGLPDKKTYYGDDAPRAWTGRSKKENRRGTRGAKKRQRAAPETRRRLNAAQRNVSGLHQKTDAVHAAQRSVSGLHQKPDAG